MPTTAELRAIVNATGAMRGARLFQNAIRLMGAAVGGLSLRRATRSAADFSDRMEELRAVAIRTTRSLGQQAREYRQLEEAARDIGRTTSLNATQAADGLLFLARAGFTVKDAITALKPSVDLARAGVLDLGRAADIATNIMTQFQVPAEGLEGVMQKIVSISIRSNTSIEQMAQGLKFAGPIAREVGLGVEEAAAAIGVLGNSGIQATHAGTNLRQILAIMAKEIQSAGGFAAALKNSRGLLDDLGGAFDTFERRATAGALTLIRNVQGIQNLQIAAAGGADEMESIARAMDQSLGRSLKRLSNSFDDFAISLEKSIFGDAFKFLVANTTKLFGIFSDFAKNLSTQVTPEITRLTEAVDAFSVTTEGIAPGGFIDSARRQLLRQQLERARLTTGQLSLERGGAAGLPFTLAEQLSRAGGGAGDLLRDLFGSGGALRLSLRNTLEDAISIDDLNRRGELPFRGLITELTDPRGLGDTRRLFEDLLRRTKDPNISGDELLAQFARIRTAQPGAGGRIAGLLELDAASSEKFFSAMSDFIETLQSADLPTLSGILKNFRVIFDADEAAQSLTKSIFDPINRAFQTADFSGIGELVVRRFLAAIAAEALKPGEQFVGALFRGLIGSAGSLANAGFGNGSSGGTPGSETDPIDVATGNARVAGASARQTRQSTVTTIQSGRR